METADSKAKSGYRFQQWNFRSVMMLAMLMKGYNLIDAKLIIIPHDTEVRINDSTYFNCSTSLTATQVQWLHHRKFYVYTGIAILEPYNDGRFLVEINVHTGASNLVIRSVQPSDAGAYECVEDEGLGEKGTAELMVLDDDPVCKSMHLHGVIGPNSCGIEPEEVRLSCSIKYHGNSLPVLQWQASDDNQSISDGWLNITSINNEVTYMLTMKSSLALNNASFICQTTRTSDKHYSCSHSTIQILYVFDSNATINMTMNDEVSCFANTSQLCSYKWKWFSGGDSTTESEDHILKPKKGGWHRCEAACSFGGISCIVNPLYANVYSDEAKKGHIRMMFVLLLVPAFAVIGVITCCWRKKLKETRTVQKEEEPLIKKTMTSLEAIKKHKDFLKERMDPDFGLLGRLNDIDAIGWHELNIVKSKVSWYQRNSQLLNCIWREDEGDALIEALRVSDQKHIANYLTANGIRSNGDKRGEDWPLTEMEISILDTNHESLVDLLELTDLLDRLYSSKVINKRQMDSISSQPTSYEKNEQLLDLLRRRSLHDYRQTITCLHQSQQSIVAKTFEEGGVVVRFHANLGEDVENVTAIENEIVTTIADMLIDGSIDQQTRTLGLFPKVVAAKAVQGIVLYIYCKTNRELEQLQEPPTLGKLKDSVESWFNSLLKQSHRITVTSLTVADKEFQKMRKHFKAETDLKTSEKILNSLPLELLDAILENSYLHWILNSTPDQGNEDIIRALASVDFCWNRRITKLKSKKRRWNKLKAVYDGTKRKAAIIRNNRSFFLENIHLSEKLMMSLNCITDEQSRLIQRQRSKRDESDMLLDVMNDKLLYVMKSLDETKFSNFVKCLRQNDHKMVARIFENGGGVIKVQVKSRVVKFMDIHKLHQNIEDYRNRKSPWSYQTHKLITELRVEDIEILNSQLDRQSVVIWLRCRSQKAIENLQKLHESNKLGEILFAFANITSSPGTRPSFSDIIHAIVINIERNQFKKTVVDSLISVTFIERINDGEVNGLTKLRNEIYVLCSSEKRSLVIRVFEDRNPFRLKRKIEKQEIRVSLRLTNLVSSEKDNCLYVSELHRKCIWKLTRETVDKYKFVKWISTDFKPSTVSVLRNGNLLLIDHSHLMFYRSDAELIRSIQLPWVPLLPYHVVETSIGTLIIIETMDKAKLGWPTAMKDYEKVVSEVTSDGQMVVRRFIPSCEEQTLSDPQYISLDSDDQVILVQSYKPNSAVVLLDSDLMWNRVLIPTKAEEEVLKAPERVYYDEEMKQLIVGGGFEGATNVYSLIRK